MPKKHTALTWITDKAKKLRTEFPKRFKKWTDYTAQASAMYRSEFKKNPPIGKRANKGKKRAVGKAKIYKPVKGITHCRTVGGTEHHKSQARKDFEAKLQVEEQLAWLLLMRDQSKNKTSRKRVAKMITSKRAELNKLK